MRTNALLVVLALAGMSAVTLWMPSDGIGAPTAAVTLTPSGDGSTWSSSYNLGFQFSVSRTIVVSALGKFDWDKDGIVDDAGGTTVQLWTSPTSSNGTQLGSVTIAGGAHATEGYVFYENLATAVTLAPGTYRIAAGNTGAERYGIAFSVTMAPEITFLEGCYTATGATAYPGTFNSAYTLPSSAAYFGANFKYDLPPELTWSGSSGSWTDSSWTVTRNSTLHTYPMSADDAVINTSGAVITVNGTCAANTIKLQQGTVSVAASNRLTASEQVMISPGAELDLGATITLASPLVSLSGTLKLLGNNAINSSSTAITVSGGGTLNLNGYSDSVGTVTLSDGSIQGGTLTAGSYKLNEGSISADLGGFGTMTKLTANRVTLSGDNSAYIGPILVGAGTLRTEHSNALGLSTVQVVSVPAGLIPYAGFTATASSADATDGCTANKAINGAGMTEGAGTNLAGTHNAAYADMWLTSNGNLSGWYKVDLGSSYTVDTIRVWNANQSDNAGRSAKETHIYYCTLETPGGDGHTFTQANGWYEIDYTSASGHCILDKASGLTGQSYTTQISLSSPILGARWFAFDIKGNWGGTQYVGLSEVRFYQLAGTYTVNRATTIASGATLEVANWTNTAVGLFIAGSGVGGAGAIHSASGDNTISGVITLTADSTIGVDAGSTLTLNNMLVGDHALTKVGGGTLEIGVDNTYNNTATISAGTLSVTGSIQGTLNIGADAKLTGSGRVKNASVSGIVAPGNSPGILTFDSLTMNDGSIYAWEVLQTGTAGTDYDKIVVSGQFTTVSGWKILLENTVALGTTISSSDQFDLVSFGSTPTLAYLPTLDISQIGGNSRWNTKDVEFFYSGGHLYMTGLVVTADSGGAVPEPAALGIVGLVLLVIRKRRA